MLSRRAIQRLESRIGLRAYRKGSVKSFRKIPGPLKLPIVGNLWQYKLGILSSLEYHKTLEQLHRQYGPIVAEKHGPQIVVHVFSPEDVKTLYLEEGKSPVIMPFQDTAQTFRSKYNLSLGLGNSNGDEWYKLRNAVRQLMLTPKSVNSYLPRTNPVVDDFINALYKKRNKNNQIPGLRDEIGRWIQESAGAICFEKRLGFFEKENEKVIHDMLTAVKTIFYYSGMLKFCYPIYKYVNTPKFAKLSHFEEFSHLLTHDYTVDAFNDIKRLVEKKELKEGQYNFLMTLLGRGDITEEDIASITHNLMVDGLTMTSPAMLANLYCLAVNQDIQEKAYQEVSKVLKKEEPMTISAMGRLPYLKAIVKETFRMYPIFFEVARVLQKDTVLSGYLVPKGTYVSITMNVHFRSEKYFRDPNKFIPERWIKGTPYHDEINHRIVTPFSVGSRACIGRRFAEQDLYTGLSKILLNFHLRQPPDGRPFEQFVNSSLYPKYPSDVQFISRS